MRFIVFLAKVEEELQTYTEQEYRVLLQLKMTDTSLHKQAFTSYKMKVLGQLDRLRNKVNTVYEKKQKITPCLVG